MSLRWRGAPAAGVAFIAFLMTNYFQPIFSEGCTTNHCSTLSQPSSTQPNCSTVLNARVSQRSSRSLGVAWNMGAQCQGTSVNYTLNYELTRQEACPESYYVPSNLITITQIYGNSYEITSLQPFTTYAISISITGGADEEFSLTGMTMPTDPVEVKYLHTAILNVNQLKFNWWPPSCTDLHGYFECYNYKLIRGNGSDADMVDRMDCTQVKQKIYRTDDLKAGTLYRFEVQVVTMTERERRTSEWKSLTPTGEGCTTDHCSTLSQPSSTQPNCSTVLNARVSQRSSRSLGVAWNMGAQCQGTSINYTLTYELTRQEACPENYYVPSNLITITQIYGNSYEMTSLQPFTTYAISISITGGADEEFSLTGMTMPADPVEVKYLRAAILNVNQLKFNWWPPSCTNLHGYFECYNYKLIRGNGSDADMVDRMDCTQVKQKIYRTDDLKACTLYRFEVQVVTMSERERRTSEWESLTPTGAPGVPKNVSISQGPRLVSDAIVTWKKPTYNLCEPERYYVTHELFYKDMCETPSWATPERIEVDHSTMHNTIQGLFSYSQYNVCVRGRNAGGDGEPACVNFTTGHEAPSNPPKRVECSNNSYDSLTFTWNKPRCGDRNGPISHYEYILNASGSNVHRRGRVSGGENGGDINFTDLIPGTMYSFIVRANNVNLSGIYGPAVEANTKITIYRPPRNVVVTSWNETTAVVEWLAADSSVFNTTGYMIVCWQSGLKENTSIVVLYDEEVCAQPCLMEATITGLKPATNHSIQVAAVYKYGEEKSRVLPFQTPEEEGCSSGHCPNRSQPTPLQRTCSLGAIRDITVTESAREARVQWNILESACQVQYIAVRYKAYQKQACGSTSTLLNTRYAYVPAVNVNQSECVIYGLEPYTSYNIQVEPTYTQARVGPSIQEMITTAPVAPPRLNVNVGLVTSEQIRIEWDPLTCINANGRFTNYHVVLLRRKDRQVRQRRVYEISSSSVTFESLLPCTNYDLSLTAVNYGQLWSPIARSAITTTAKVLSARVSRRSSRSLKVAWTVAAQCQGTTINYTLTYELTRQEGCPEGYLVSSDLITITPIYGNSYEITSLQPFATYAISFSITGGADEEFSLTGMTMPIAPPRLNVSVGLVMSEHIRFEWDPLTCINANGRFTNYHVLLLRRIDRQVRQRRVYEISSSSVTFESLLPCTTYDLSLTAVNYGQLWSPIARSAITTTAKVLNAWVSQRSSSSLKVAWNLAAHCKGTTINYTLTYELTRQEACLDSYLAQPDLITITPIYGNSYEIASLQPFATYAISISITGGGHGEFSLTGMTMPTDSVGVQHLRTAMISNSNQLKFYWAKPMCADLHGYFKCYNYKLVRGNGSDTDMVDRGDCTQVKQKTYRMDDLQACTLFRFKVQVVTMTDRERRTSEWESVEAIRPILDRQQNIDYSRMAENRSVLESNCSRVV